ncbi:hypothetical protein TNCV_3288191 [Trichonephila clavipes]|nr:hypothetical protein TNCV_3288191 [Trichonephila clavipes]
MAGMDATLSKTDKQAVIKFSTLERSHRDRGGNLVSPLLAGSPSVYNGNFPTHVGPKIQSLAVSRKGDVDGLVGQQFHSNDGNMATALNWLHDQPTLFFVDEIRNLSKQ